MTDERVIRTDLNVDVPLVEFDVRKQGPPGVAGPVGPQGPPGRDGTGQVNQIVGGAGILVDNTDPTRPIVISLTGLITLHPNRIDLETYHTIIDDNIGATFITAAAKPVSPQYTHTISAGDFPAANVNIQDYMCVATIGGQNTDLGADNNLNYTWTKNGTDIEADNALYVAAGQYWAIGSLFALSALAPGDVLGLKIWADFGALTTYAYATFYIIPRKFAVPTGLQLVANTDVYVYQLGGGAIPGVTYRASAGFKPAVYDSVLSQAIQSGVPVISTIAPPLQLVNILSGQTVFADANQIAGDVQGTSFLWKFGPFAKYAQNFTFTVA